MTQEQEHVDPRSDPARTLKEFPYFTARPVTGNAHSAEQDIWVVGVFQHDADGAETQVGSYERNYRFMRTFWWFRRGTRHFALYSTDYTATRVMEIFPGQGFKDIGGEDPDEGGFCPVELYVPDCRKHEFQEHSGLGELIVNWSDPLASLAPGCEFGKTAETHRGRAKLRDAEGRYIEREELRETLDGAERLVKVPAWGTQQDYESGWIRYPPDHGFVYGCFWACPYQIQYLDLSRVEEGIIRREERFGYIDLPSSVLLRNAVQLDNQSCKVSIAITSVWDLQRGRLLSPEIGSV